MKKKKYIYRTSSIHITGFQMYMYINQHVHILAKGFDFLRGHLHPGDARYFVRSKRTSYLHKVASEHSRGAGVDQSYR